MEGEEGQAKSWWCGAWRRIEDSGKWRMKKVGKMEEENKEILDSRWWRKGQRGSGEEEG